MNIIKFTDFIRLNFLACKIRKRVKTFYNTTFSERKEIHKSVIGSYRIMLFPQYVKTPRKHIIEFRQEKWYLSGKLHRTLEDGPAEILSRSTIDLNIHSRYCCCKSMGNWNIQPVMCKSRIYTKWYHLGQEHQPYSDSIYKKGVMTSLSDPCWDPVKIGIQRPNRTLL